MRLDAYYYGFEPTGVEAIDRILSAVACAGKAYHLTEDWQEAAEYMALGSVVVEAEGQKERPCPSLRTDPR